MVDSVSTNLLSQVQYPQVKPAVNPVTVPVAAQVPQQQEVASKAASAAAVAYAAPLLNQAMPATSEEYINQLKNSGKVEGKDFKVENDEKFVDVSELDQNGKIIKGSAWIKEDGKEKPMGMDYFAYGEDGRILYRDCKDANGKLELHAHHYYNDKVPQNIISHDDLTFETKVEDYIKNLQEKGVKYTEQIEYGDDGKSKSHIVEEYTSDGKQTLKTVWVTSEEKPEFDHVYRDLYRADGGVSTSVLFDNEKSIVVNFFKK